MDDEIHWELRKFAGVANIELLLKTAQFRPAPLWCDEYLEASALADRISSRLFGITEADTRHTDDPYASQEHNEARWRALELTVRDGGPVEGPPDEIIANFREYGWGISDGEAGVLRCFPFFARQIILVMEGVIGRLPDEDMSGHEVEALHAKLQAQVEEFKRGR